MPSSRASPDEKGSDECPLQLGPGYPLLRRLDGLRDVVATLARRKGVGGSRGREEPRRRRETVSSEIIQIAHTDYANGRKLMARKIDPLNKKHYGSLSAVLTVSNMKAAMAFYQKAFGFEKRGLMAGPNGKPVHGEMVLRGTALMLSPENPAWGARSAKAVGASPASLYLLVEDVDKTVAKAIKLGATVTYPVTDMFWGDRCGTIVDPDGYSWMVATHKSEPTPQEIRKKMKEQMSQGGK
jgi:PhnB protein